MLVPPACVCEDDGLAHSDDKGAIHADIPVDAVQEALRAVERIADGAAPAAEAVAEAGDPGPLAAEVEALKAQLELSTAMGRETLEKLKQEHDRVLRTAADLENYRKRAAKERDEVQKFGNERLLKDLFPVVDGLDRALAAAPPDDPLVEGVRLVRATLEQALARHGVTGFSALGAKFDPALHEALLQVPTRDQPPGVVVLEHARGFKLNDRLVRPAMVGVSVEPPPDPAAPAGPG